MSLLPFIYTFTRTRPKIVGVPIQSNHARQPHPQTSARTLADGGELVRVALVAPQRDVHLIAAAVLLAGAGRGEGVDACVVRFCCCGVWGDVWMGWGVCAFNGGWISPARLGEYTLQ